MFVIQAAKFILQIDLKDKRKQTKTYRKGRTEETRIKVRRHKIEKKKESKINQA